MSVVPGGVVVYRGHHNTELYFTRASVQAPSDGGAYNQACGGTRRTVRGPSTLTCDLHVFKCIHV